MKFIREAKRVVSQFFETEYWYRWRNKKHYFVNGYGKTRKETEWNGFNLADTWDGECSMFKYFDMKLTHMLYNLRRWHDESTSYIDGGAAAAYGTDEDRRKILFEAVCQLRDVCTHCKKEIDFMDESWYQDCSKYVYDKEALKRGAHLNVAGMTLGWADDCRPYELVFVSEFDGYDLGGGRDLWYITKRGSEPILGYDGDGDIVRTLKSIPKFGKVVNDFKYYQFRPIASPTERIIKEVIPDWSFDKFAIAQHTFNIKPTEYRDYSKDLIANIRGNRRKLRSIWQFRKMLRDYRKYAIGLMDNEHLYDEALELDDVERFRKFDEITQKEVYDKMFEKLKEIARFFADHNQEWYD